jgi:hypothetical protein
LPAQRGLQGGQRQPGASGIAARRMNQRQRGHARAATLHETNPIEYTREFLSASMKSASFILS